MLLDRPAELLNDPPMNEILLHDTSVFPADFYLQVRPPQPMIARSRGHAALRGRPMRGAPAAEPY